MATLNQPTARSEARADAANRYVLRSAGGKPAVVTQVILSGRPLSYTPPPRAAPPCPRLP